MDETRKEPAIRQMREDTCQLCYAHGPDKRTVVMSCFYDLEEVVPEFEHIGGIYKLRVCKTCRSELLFRLQDWRKVAVSKREFPKDSDGWVELNEPGRDIPVRILGATVMLTREEYDKWQESMTRLETDGLSGSLKS